MYLCQTKLETKQDMKRICFILLLCIPTLCSTARSNKELYKTLDSLISCYDKLTAEKEQRINSIKQSTGSIALTPEQTYDLNMRLYDEYMAYRFDSAYYYINRNVQALRGTADRQRFAASAIRMAHILSVSGLFGRVHNLLGEINPDSLSDEQKIAYYNQQSELNLYRSEMAQYTDYFTDYIQQAQYYRQLIIQIAPQNSQDYIFNKATYISEQGNNDKAIEMLENYLLQLQEGSRDYSIVTSTLAYFYRKKGDISQQEHYLLLSAISDEKGAIRENNSLRSLAEILMERGDNDEAYHYLFQAISEAKFYGSRLRMMQVGRMAPQIMQLYDQKRSQTQRNTYIYLGIISLISLVLLLIMYDTLKLYRKEQAASKKIEEMNLELTAQNMQILGTNNEMKEVNRIKDEYIGRFLQLSSNLIKRGEEHGKHLNRLARDRKLDDLYAELKSQQFLNGGIRMFHQNFDEAFLNIYPDFIAEVNKLMTEDNQFMSSEDGYKKLTTELRILALIRLGISDNQEIADILRSSITTIYTYRSKLKAKSINKEAFEDDIRKIATY